MSLRVAHYSRLRPITGSRADNDLRNYVDEICFKSASEQQILSSSPVRDEKTTKPGNRMIIKMNF